MFRGHDMPRARTLFDGLRRAAANDTEGMGKVDVAVYNQFIVTFFDLATPCDEADNRRALVASAWELWENLAEDGVDPDYTTYASLLLLSARYVRPFRRKCPYSYLSASDLLQQRPEAYLRPRTSALSRIF